MSLHRNFRLAPREFVVNYVDKFYATIFTQRHQSPTYGALYKSLEKYSFWLWDEETFTYE